MVPPPQSEAQQMQPCLRLDGKVTVVTGGSRGIGQYIAEVFGAAGATCYALSRTPAPRKPGRRVTYLRCDAGSRDDVIAALGAVVEQEGALDVVVANAATMEALPFQELTEQECVDLLRVNVGGVIYAFQAAIMHMQGRRRGSLIAVGSTAGLRGGGPGHVVYGATKAALVGLAVGLAREVGHLGIRVNVLAPGAIADTPMAEIVAAEQGAQFGKGAFLGRPGGIDEVADGALYLASDASSYVTGSVLRVDGGSLFRH